MNKKLSILIAALTIPAGAVIADEGASESRYATSNLQVSITGSADNDYITGYGADGGDRVQVRFEHNSDYALGENYFFMDRVSFDNPAGAAFGEGDTGTSELYGLWNSNIMLGRLLKKDVGAGPFKDYSVEIRLEAGSFFSYRASSVGLGATWMSRASVVQMTSFSSIGGAGRTVMSSSRVRLERRTVAAMRITTSGA